MYSTYTVCLSGKAQFASHFPQLLKHKILIVTQSLSSEAYFYIVKFETQPPMFNIYMQI